MGRRGTFAEATPLMSLVRPRVGALIKTALAQGAVTLLVAPPGFGKTIALRDTIGADPSVTWVDFPTAAKLEDVVRILIEHLAPASLPAVAALFNSEGKPSSMAYAVAWTETRMRTFDGTVVIDDLHRSFEDKTVMNFLVRLIESTASWIKWVFASRETPDMPLGTWVANGRMALPITDYELRFDNEESIELAASLNVDIDPEITTAIVDDTDGWPMAVHLGLQLWERTRSLGPLKVRTRELLFSQIEHELWPALDNELREVITACALLPETTASLLFAAGFYNAEALLERANRTIPFVQKRLDGAYVLHDLFGEFIQRMLRYDPKGTVGVQERLAAAFLEQGKPVESLRLFIAAGDGKRVLSVLALHGFHLLEYGNRGAVSGAIDFLSTSGFQNDPIVSALRGRMSFADGSSANAEALLTYAFDRGLPATMRITAGSRLATIYYNRGDGVKAAAILEPILADKAIPFQERMEIRAQLAMAYAVAGSVDGARDVISAVQKELPMAQPTVRAKILQRLGFALFYLGDHSSAAEYSRDCAQLATGLGMDILAAHAYSILYSCTAVTEADSSVPLAYARLMIAAAERAADRSMTALGLRVTYELHADRGDDAGVDETEKRLVGFNDIRSFQDLFPVRLARALSDATQGLYRRAVSTLNVADSAGLTVSERALKDAYLCLFLILGDRRDESLDLLKAPLLVEASEDFISRRSMNLAHAIRGVALWCHDRTAQARRSFVTDDGALAERDRALFGALAEICSTAKSMVTSESAAAPLARLREYGWGAYARILDKLIETNRVSVILTAAELRTLRAFRYGLSQDEVAKALGKSPHTIEAQLKSAYRKIGCTSRAEALAYARAQGWLEESLGIPETR
jgi:ATP/maltotriose-dependent transcriptional regulator MalT